MGLRRCWWYRLGAVVGALLASVAGAQPEAFDRLIVFGDSLSDTGNIFAVAQQPAPPYYEGRITNGPNWIDYVGMALELPGAGAAQAQAGSNYAFGFAESGTGLSAEGAPNFGSQVTLFLTREGGMVTGNELVAVWFGGNDIFGGIVSDDPGRIADNVVAQLDRLADAGLRHFLVLNVPATELVPAVADDPDARQRYAIESATANAALETQIPAWADGRAEAVTVTLFDTHTAMETLVGTTGYAPFANLTDPALSAWPDVDPATYLFWDDEHPTSEAHRVIAQNAVLALRGDDPAKTFFPEALAYDGTRAVRFFGAFDPSPWGWPWVLHREHQHIFLARSGPDGFSLWDPRFGDWLYTSATLYPYLYRFFSDGSGGEWLFYVRQDEPADEPGRWFYRFRTPADPWLFLPRDADAPEPPEVGPFP